MSYEEFINSHKQSYLKNVKAAIVFGDAKARLSYKPSHEDKLAGTLFAEKRLVVDAREIVLGSNDKRYEAYRSFLKLLEPDEENKTFIYVFSLTSETHWDGNFFSHSFLPDVTLYEEAIDVYSPSTERDIAALGLKAVNCFKSVAERGATLTKDEEGAIVPVPEPKSAAQDARNNKKLATAPMSQIAVEGRYAFETAFGVDRGAPVAPAAASIANAPGTSGTLVAPGTPGTLITYAAASIANTPKVKSSDSNRSKNSKRSGDQSTRR